MFQQNFQLIESVRESSEREELLFWPFALVDDIRC